MKNYKLLFKPTLYCSLILGLTACDIAGIRFTNPVIDTSGLPLQQYRPGTPHYPSGNLPYLMAKREESPKQLAELSLKPPEEQPKEEPLKPQDEKTDSLPWWKRIFGSNSTPQTQQEPSSTQLAEADKQIDNTPHEPMPEEPPANQKLPWWKRAFSRAEGPSLNDVPEKSELADEEAEKESLRRKAQELKQSSENDANIQEASLMPSELNKDEPLPTYPIECDHDTPHDSPLPIELAQQEIAVQPPPQLQEVAPTHDVMEETCHYVPPKLIPKSRYTKKRQQHHPRHHQRHSLSRH